MPGPPKVKDRPKRRQQRHVTQVWPHTFSKGLERRGWVGPQNDPRERGVQRGSGLQLGLSLSLQVAPSPGRGETRRRPLWGRAVCVRARPPQRPRRRRGDPAGRARPGVTFSCSSRSRATSEARSGAALAAEPPGGASIPPIGSFIDLPSAQRGERVLKQCLWRRRGGRRLPSCARVLAFMHRAPRVGKAALGSAAAAQAAARVRAAARCRRISHAHAARRRRRRRGLRSRRPPGRSVRASQLLSVGRSQAPVRRAASASSSSASSAGSAPSDSHAPAPRRGTPGSLVAPPPWWSCDAIGAGFLHGSAPDWKVFIWGVASVWLLPGGCYMYI